MMMFEIKNSWDGQVIFKLECGSIRLCVEAAVKAGADLSGANLSGANLSGADLSRADLSGADLYRANLSGANLYGADLYGADLSGANLSRATLYRADLSRANLYGADLYGADLSGANLSRANLYGADLSRANLYGAGLSGANLSGANLSGANGIDANRTTQLRILLEQTGSIRAYKLVTAEGIGPFNGGITYEVGKEYAVSDASTDEAVECGPGINLATLDWCMKEWNTGYRILVAEFTAADIAAIPACTDGKFRVRRCRIVAEKDLTALGLVKSPTVVPDVEAVA
ncbi:MAG: pentapeptide repeat-containing protein [Tepidisphaeraceae bacterium]